MTDEVLVILSLNYGVFFYVKKGTGKWTAIESLDYGIPVTLIGEAVFARCLSSLFTERANASKVLKGPANTHYSGDKAAFVESVRKVCYFLLIKFISVKE